MTERYGSYPIATVRINGGKDVGQWVDLLKWSSFINGGYVVYARFYDPTLKVFSDIMDSKYLADARKEPLPISFSLRWGVESSLDQAETDTRVAYITNVVSLNTDSAGSSGYFEFVAIDPPSWWLNYGDSDGAAYTGSVHQVITRIVNKYAPNIKLEISSTTDSSTNTWHQMRQVPKDFILSLLDWSSSVTNNRTSWVVASVDEKLIIKEQAELKSADFGEYSINTNYPGAHNCIRWEVLSDNYLTSLQTAMDSSGISAVSGLYVSKDDTNPVRDKAIVSDNNTQNKRNIQLTDEQSFAKPTNLERGWSSIRSIPEDSAGAVGVNYQDYIDGRARGIYINMLYGLFRMKIRVYGSPKVSDSSQLGVSKVTVRMHDAGGDPYIYDGSWMCYGFEHIYDRDNRWYTDLYISRFDHDAASQKISR